ncbi:hypothetical protein [Streptomyces sp. KMM 9044]|uniref:hypothetical protein n=1 Tax=Streptomyces sp. KMM 9044 TaxID=2744474 RepID=UPI0021515093|nr:hypothetical protein [Streptomyces sp. KMM 9044]WAX79625.1 hypothetical protein HUV60_020085 [Streptomyces sp. KMM 9044]
MNPEEQPMMTTSGRLMAAAEALACVTLAGMCIAMALTGDHLAWLFGFGSLSFAWDLWRRLGKAKANSNPMGQHDR